MLLTFFYMIATIMQARRMSFLKAHLNAIFKGNKSRRSITLNIKSSQYLEDHIGYEPDGNCISSHLCINKSLAKLDQLLWYQENVKLYTIYPQQQVDISDWLTYPCGDSLFPLYINNCCQILSKSDFKMHILVEVDLETYGSRASKAVSAKLEEYGLITAWTVSSRNMSFILETDIEHLTSFIIGVMQEQYCINNGLLLTRIQSVSVLGKPRIYNDVGHLGPPPNKNSFYALCDAIRIASKQNKPKKVVKLCDVSVQPQDNNLNTETFTEEFFENVVKDIGAKSSRSAPATRHSSPVAEQPDVNFSEILRNLNCILPKEVIIAINERERSDNLTKADLPDVTETKDNTLLDTNNEESKNIDQGKSTTETASFEADFKNSELEGEEKRTNIMKPPNILICADSLTAIDNIEKLLSKVLEPDRYVIYVLCKGNYNTYNIWKDQVSLIVLCGNVAAEIGTQLIEYVIQGGKLLALCSDMLHILLPSFKTTEVRENKLVHFSYDKWKRVRMMHHIFCYHASPIRTRFSQDHEDPRTPALNPPSSTNVKDKKGNLHSFDVKVLGREETWHSPSILLATLASSGGKVVFSQIHLEIDPMQYVYEEDKFDALKKSNIARLEIIKDLLSTHLGLDTSHDQINPVQYTPAYFLGKFEMKTKMLEKLKAEMKENNILKLSNLQIQFCTNNEDIQLPSANFLPIMMHMCPANFSTVDYFENLYTKELGRLVIYTDIVKSSMDVADARLEHGLIVIPRQQTQGRGRQVNKWLSPIGCAMFTLQVHISLMSNLGCCISLLQHIATVALVSAIRSIKGYEDIDLRIKWPNDVYISDSIKIGGVIVSTRAENGGAMFVCNVGAAINLSNSKPTSCINDMILQYNQKYGTKLKTFSYEKFLALVFNEMEILLDLLHSGNTEHFYQLYYKYWLHTNSNVTVTWKNGRKERVTILGIDNYGYLLVQAKNGIFSVHSDGNTFDLFKGLIIPK